MFEQATREKFRFPFRGQIGVEDLWDLSVKDLDSVFKTLNREAKQAEEESLLTTKTKETAVLDVKIAIVKHIVSVKMEEVAERKLSAQRAEERKKLMALIADKEDESLRNKSVEELKAMLSALV